MQVSEAMWQIILRNDQNKSELSLKELGWPVLQQNVPRGILAGRVEVQGWNWEGFMIRDSSVQWVRLNFIFSGQRVIKVKKKYQRRWQRVSSFNGNCLQKHFTKHSQSLLKVRRQLWKVCKLDLTSEIHYTSLHITPFNMQRRNFGWNFEMLQWSHLGYNAIVIEASLVRWSPMLTKVREVPSEELNTDTKISYFVSYIKYITIHSFNTTIHFLIQLYMLYEVICMHSL